MKQPKYKFTIAIGPTETIEVHPHYKELAKKYSKQSQEEFFRTTLEGKITLFAKDYELIANSNIESRFILYIHKYDTQLRQWAVYFEGRFSKTDCVFDHSRKRCEIKLAPHDSYSNIMDGFENTYDLVKLAPEITKINLYKRSLMQVYILGANSISNFFGGTYWESEVLEAIDNEDALVNKYYFTYVKAGNEFYINGAGVQEANGVYAGTDNSWDNWNSYRAKLTKVISKGDVATITPSNAFQVYAIYADENRKPALVGQDSQGQGNYNYYIYTEDLYKLQIISGDGTVAYESEYYYYIDTSRNANNVYIDRNDIRMVNTINKADRFKLDNVFVYHIYQRLLCDVDRVETSQGITPTYDLPFDDFVVDNRNYKKCIGLKGGLFFCTSKTSDAPTKYGVNDYGKYFTNKFIPPSSGAGRILPVSRNSWANASLWYTYDLNYYLLEKRLRKQYVLKDSYSIAAVIKVLLRQISPAISHEATAEYSNFLYSPAPPIQMDRFYVYITQKTNILKGDYDQAAQKAEISFKELTDMLRDCFRCYWYIEDNKLKIEHILFFMNGGSYTNKAKTQLDFTTLIDQFNKKPVSYFQSETSYNKSELSHRYEFGWMDDVTEVFESVTLDVNSVYVQSDKKEEINVSKFSSDIDYMMFSPSNFSEDGFALLCPISNDTSLELPIVDTNVFDENENLYRIVAQNWYASWIYLSRFYMYDMPAAEIQNSALGTVTASVKKSMEHTVQFIAEDDLDVLQLIKTELGDGKIVEYSVDLETRLAKVKLAYTPK